MAITPLPSIDRTSVTFKTDVDTLFLTQLPAFVGEANTLAADVLSAQSTASAAATTATASAGIATAKAVLTAADAVTTAADRVQTGLDRVAIELVAATAGVASVNGLAGAVTLKTINLNELTGTGNISIAGAPDFLLYAQGVI